MPGLNVGASAWLQPRPEDLLGCMPDFLSQSQVSLRYDDHYRDRNAVSRTDTAPEKLRSSSLRLVFLIESKSLDCNKDLMLGHESLNGEVLAQHGVCSYLRGEASGACGAMMILKGRGRLKTFQ